LDLIDDIKSLVEFIFEKIEETKQISLRNERHVAHLFVYNKNCILNLMKNYRFLLHLLILLFISIQTFDDKIFAQSCDPTTPTFTFNLSGKPDSVWISPSVTRKGICCGLDPTAKPPIRCIEFYFTLDTAAQGIRFDIASGAIPPGALGYQISCGPVNPVGSNICLSGPGPHRLTFCEPGNNPNTYSITSIAKPKVSKPIVVSNACTGTMTATGFDVNTIQWTSVPFNATYNSYLSCSSKCSTTVVTYQIGAPAYIDYQVSGVPLGGCSNTLVTSTTRVYFVNDKKATIQPQDPVICFGGTSATVTAYGSGGAPPYKYKWSTGETSQSINVGVGTYWVEVSDSTSCPTAGDTVTVTAFLSPITANAGPDITSCANNPSVQLNGSVFQAQGGKWSGGSGTYAPSDTSLIATYTPTASEITSGKVRHVLTTTGNRNCPPSYDTTYQTIVPSPIVNAGADKTVCANNPPFVLSGTVQNATGGVWSGGTGTFSPGPNSLNVTYTPTASEISAGSVTLTLTSTGNGTCNPVSDQVVLTITPAPTVNAGPDRTICANNPLASLTGTITIATGGIWTGGKGTFTPSTTSLTPTYKPTLAEIAAGSVTLTLTSTGNGSCLPVSDQIIVQITPAPTVDAGPDQTVCANNSTTTLTGIVTVASGGIWSGGAGTFSPNNTTLNATYKPTASEITSGIVTLTLTSTGNGNCIAVSDKIVIHITPAPTVNSGPDITVCGNNATAKLSGTVTIATGGTWSGGLGTFTPNANALNASYTPSASEITAGKATLTLTTTGNGNCLAVTDQMIITITPAPIVNAGADQSVCFNNSIVSLAGTASIATGGVWTGGTGSYSPNANTLTTQYYPSASEKTSGSVTLTLTSTGNGSCLPVTDQIQISITPAPTIDAGSDLSICANNATATLNGTVTIATGATWTGGAGTFTPNATTLNASYKPSATEITNGSVTLTITSTGNGKCIAVADKMIISITPAPTINAGPDQSVCSNSANVNLNGTVTVSSGGTWTSSGTGSFNPSANTLTTNYVPSSADTTTGSVTLTLSSTGNGNCLAVSDNLVINFTHLPTANAGPDQTVCTNNFPIQLNATGTPGSWSGGAGTFQPGTNVMNPTYLPSSAEISAQTVTLTFTASNGTCPSISDIITITIPPGPTANAGNTLTVCADTSYIQLNGSITVASGGTWTTSGTGTFSNNNILNPTYTPSIADTTAGSVNLYLTTTGNASCNPPGKDTLLITFTHAPSIYAGPDVTVCADTLGVPLDAIVTIATSAKWLTSGTGSFTPNANTLQPSYVLSVSDTASRTVTLTAISTNNGSCKAVSDQLVITITPVPVVNAGLDQTVCADSPSATLTGTVYNATGGLWTSSGTGVFSPSPYSLNSIYYPSAGDRASGTVNLNLTSTGNGNCKASSQSSLILSITPAPTANAGPDQTVCADTSGINLNGKITVASTAKWSSNGTGSFLPNDSSLMATYIPSAADINQSTVTLTLTTTGANCINVSDQVVISITPTPTVRAGTDKTVCANNSTLSLAGAVTVATGGIWSNGTGTITPSATNLNINYTPSLTEVSNGLATLVLSTTGNGSCKAVKDTIQIFITPAPKANAGPDQTLCMDANKVALTGSATVATSGSWTTTGSGIFNPSSSNFSPDYYPTSKDKTDSTVQFVLTTTGNGNCLAVTDTMFVYFSPLPTVDAGPVSLCSDLASVQLSGSVTVAPTGVWTTTGTGSFTPSNQIINPSYSPSAVDKAKGSVILKLTATTCKAISDSMVLYIIPAPTANAGPDQTICANNSLTSITGTINNATGGLWSSVGAGMFSSTTTTLSNSYTPSAADVSKGYAMLILQSTGNGTCKASTDTLVITITPAPTVSAGPDQTVCADIGSINLSSIKTISSGVTWSSSGTGSFTPSQTALITSYKPSVSDITTGAVTLTVTTTGNGNCKPVSDDLKVTITPAPTINAGPDQTVCIDVNSVAFYGTTTVASGGTWISKGTGSFDNSNNLHTIYTLSSTDKTNGQVQLILTSTGNGTCNAVKDTVLLSLTSLPTSNAGVDQTVCNENKGIKLGGTVTGASGGNWSSSGTGSFTPSNSQLKTTYIPTPSDTTTGQIKLYLTTNVIGGCSVFDSLVVNFIDPKLNLPDHYCFQKNLLVDSKPLDTMPSGQFKWYKNDTIIQSASSSSIIVNQRGIYKVSYTFDQCTVADSSNITYPVDLTSSDKLICTGGSTTLTTTLVPKATYIWEHNGNPYGTNSNNISITDDGNALYIVTMIDSLSCQKKDTAYANTIPPPVMTLSNIPSCIGQTVTLNASPSNNTDPANSKYQWLKNGSALPDTLSTLTVKTTGKYEVIYTLGECKAKDSSNVTFYPLPVPSNRDYLNFCKEEEGSATLDAGPAVKYYWLQTGDSTKTETASNAGIYYFKIFNQYQCEIKDSIELRDICPPRLFVPTVFSPNGDGKNDKFDISGRHFKNFKLIIFNRWGEIIFVSEDRYNSWDGIYREAMMPIGVYPWIITYEGEFEEYKGPYKMEGSVTLTK
jgi:gliding motility-associated-like protein